jgi:hypothetical protein
MKHWYVVAIAVIVVAGFGAQKQTDADRAASIVIRWQQLVYPKFEDARAFVSEEVSDRVNALLSDGAVRVVQDHADAPGIKKADAAVDAFASAMLKAGTRRDDGSRVLEVSSFKAALDASCPLYPLCDR